MNTRYVVRTLFVSLFLFSFFSVFQVQAVGVGVACTSSSQCDGAGGPYSCKSITDDPATLAIEGGVCGGPCTANPECSGVASTLGWAAAKCTGTPAVAGPPLVPAVQGVCLELPGQAQRLPDVAPASTGLQLLAAIDTVTNWIFAVFVILAIIFVLLAAFQFVTAGGQAEKVGEARQKLIWAAVGIIIALLAKGLVPVIRAIVGG